MAPNDARREREERRRERRTRSTRRKEAEERREEEEERSCNCSERKMKHEKQIINGTEEGAKYIQAGPGIAKMNRIQIMKRIPAISYTVTASNVRRCVSVWIIHFTSVSTYELADSLRKTLATRKKERERRVRSIFLLFFLLRQTLSYQWKFQFILGLKRNPKFSKKRTCLALSTVLSIHH